jgi:hypothetical protein
MPSDLPIVTPDPPKRPRPAAEKYGSLYYLGLAGLIVLVGLVASFGVGLWSLRGVLRHIYTLHDPRRGEADRIAAAYALTRDPNFTDRQAWDIALRKDLPPLARYLVAESLTPAIVAADPRAYTLAVARSRHWPGWLRVLALRPLAYAADDNLALPEEGLSLLPHDESVLGLWAAYIRAAAVGFPDSEGAGEGPLARAARTGPHAELAGLLLAALRERGPRREALLDRATLWLRTGDPECRAVWDGWAVRDGRIVRDPAHKLHGGPRTPTDPLPGPPAATGPSVGPRLEEPQP